MNYRVCTLAMVICDMSHLQIEVGNEASSQTFVFWTFRLLDPCKPCLERREKERVGYPAQEEQRRKDGRILTINGLG